jgi:hypothetical protein
MENITENTTFSAESNPGLANSIVEQVISKPVVEEAAIIEVISPTDTTVDLPGGFINSIGEVVRVAEVKELNGRDEEYISKANSTGKMLSAVISRGVVSIGGEKATERMLDALLAGDRDALLLGIYRATFGNTAEINSYCSGCEDWKQVEVDLSKDIEFKVLIDPIEDRTFTVKGRRDEYLVGLPTGHTQKELNVSVERTMSEMATVLLQDTIQEINGLVVYNKDMVNNIGIQDRRTISEAIAEHSPGPQFNDLKVTCPECTSEVVVPINLGALFRL